jgi:hypothetical protein
MKINLMCFGPWIRKLSKTRLTKRLNFVLNVDWQFSNHVSSESLFRMETPVYVGLNIFLTAIKTMNIPVLNSVRFSECTTQPFLTIPVHKKQSVDYIVRIFSIRFSFAIFMTSSQVANI